MSMRLIFGTALLEVMALAQASDVPIRMGAALLVLPRPGVAVSLEQLEERVRKLEGGTSTIEVVESRIYRDSAGRLRIESEIRDGSGQPSKAHTVLIDPVNGSMVVLLSAVETAYRMPLPKSDTLRVGSVIAEEQSLAHKWTTRTESTGKRTIQGQVFEGTHIVQTAEDEPRLTYTIDEWYSDELKLTGLVVKSGPHGTETARIRNIHRGELDPTLFRIPPDYKTVDLDLSSPKPE